MRILYNVSTLRRGGPTNQLLGIISNLNKNDFTPYILTLSPEPTDSMMNDFKALNINVQSLSMDRLKGLFYAEKEVEQIISAIKPNLIHSQGIRADVIASKLKKRIPSVSTLRCNPFKDYPQTYGKFQGNIMAYRHTAALKRLDKCVVVSESVKLFMRDILPVCSVVRNGVDTSKFSIVDKQQKAALRNSLNFKKDIPLFISTGHLTPLKDPETMIQGFLNSNVEGILILLGSGSLEGQLKAKYSKETDRIIFVGRVTNVADYLQASDFFISASTTEGMPNAVIEAMACGLPVILSDIPAHKEVLELAQDVGIPFSLGNTHSLAEAINDIIKRQYRQIQQKASDTVNNFFSAKMMADNYQKIYNELIQGGKI